MTIGTLVVVLVAGILAFGIFHLPGAPSQYQARFPIVSGALPNDASQASDTDRLGFDLYTNTKAKPDFLKSDRLPATRRRTWGVPSQQDGTVHVRGTFWIEFNKGLYEIGHFEKQYLTDPNRFLNATTIVTIDTSRKIRERVLIPELNIDETFGPFDLP